MADKNETRELKKKPKKDKGAKKDKGERRRFRRVRETWSELKKVTWPTFGTVMKSLGAVLIIMAVFVVLLLAFDLILRFFAFNPLTTGTISGNSSVLEPLRNLSAQLKLLFSRSL